MNERDVLLNELAQGPRPMSQGIEWFDSLGQEEQSEVLLFLRHHCARASCPFHSLLVQRGQLFLGEFVASSFGVGDPHTQFHGHGFRFTVDRDLFGVPAGYRPVAFPFDPLREGREPALEGLLRL
ncbi:hypothetical protein RKD39_000223, partial [Streptomyces albogriseolus]